MKIMIPKVEKILSEKYIFHLHKGKLYITGIYPQLSIISFVDSLFTHITSSPIFGLLSSLYTITKFFVPCSKSGEI